MLFYIQNVHVQLMFVNKPYLSCLLVYHYDITYWLHYCTILCSVFEKWSKEKLFPLSDNYSSDLHVAFSDVETCQIINADTPPYK